MLQAAFEAQVRKTFYQKAVKLIEKKIEDEGLSLSKGDKKKLLRALREGELDSLSLGKWRFWDRRNVTIQITKEDLGTLERDAHAFLDSLPDMVPALVEDLTSGVVKWLERKGRRQLKKERQELRRFEKRLAATWREPFDLLGLVIHLATQVGQNVGGRALEAEADDEQLTSVMVRLHGRGLRISKEVVALLRSGFADAALARWRTLHEVTVVASFVLEHGASCAERYVAHHAVANYKGALSYQRSAPRLGFRSFEHEELARLKNDRDTVVSKYGKEFGTDYGWATPFLGGAPANFAEIEKSISFDHFRPLHKWASQEVHAGVKALFSDLAAPAQDIVLVGPSNTGFADPGQNTCLSLAVLTTELLQLSPTVDALVLCSAMNRFVDQATERFVAVQHELETVA